MQRSKVKLVSQDSSCFNIFLNKTLESDGNTPYLVTKFFLFIKILISAEEKKEEKTEKMETTPPAEEKKGGDDVSCRVSRRSPTLCCR